VLDLSGDGMPDILAARSGDSTVGVLVNRGDGTFGEATLQGEPGDPSAMAVGDFNRDQVPDVALAFPLDDTVRVLLNRGGGIFAVGTRLATGDGTQLGADPPFLTPTPPVTLPPGVPHREGERPQAAARASAASG